MPFLAPIAAGVAGVAGAGSGAAATIGGVAGAVGSLGQGIAGAIAGAGAGGQQRNLSPTGQLELQGIQSASRGLNQFEEFIGLGPGGEDVAAGAQAQRDLASQLQTASQEGLLPTEQDIQATGNIAEQLFQSQRLAQEQAFAQQRQGAQRQAALLGRSATDPVLAAKLAQSQTQQNALLSAEQGSFAQRLALQQPGQRLSLAASRAEVLGGLASQALNNRQTLTRLGAGIRGQESAFRADTAGKGPDAAARTSQGLAGFFGTVDLGFGDQIGDVIGSLRGKPDNNKRSAGAGSTVQKGQSRGGDILDVGDSFRQSGFDRILGLNKTSG